MQRQKVNVMDLTADLYSDPQFIQDCHQAQGYEHLMLGLPEPKNWYRYLWKSAYSEARYQLSDEGARQIAQAEADGAWFGHTGNMR